MSALLVPVILIAGLILIIVVWAWTGPLIAVIVFSLVASFAVWVAQERRRRARYRDD